MTYEEGRWVCSICGKGFHETGSCTDGVDNDCDGFADSQDGKAQSILPSMATSRETYSKTYL